MTPRELHDALDRAAHALADVPRGAREDLDELVRGLARAVVEQADLRQAAERRVRQLLETSRRDHATMARQARQLSHAAKALRLMRHLDTVCADPLDLCLWEAEDSSVTRLPGGALRE